MGYGHMNWFQFQLWYLLSRIKMEKRIIAYDHEYNWTHPQSFLYDIQCLNMLTVDLNLNDKYTILSLIKKATRETITCMNASWWWYGLGWSHSYWSHEGTVNFAGCQLAMWAIAGLPHSFEKLKACLSHQVKVELHLREV